MTKQLKATKKGRTTVKLGKNGLFPVSPHILLSAIPGGFSLYLEQRGRMVLYAAKGEIFTEAHRDRLSSLGIERLYVRGCERADYDQYIRDNLTAILNDESIPCSARAGVFCEATTAAAREAFDRSLPNPGGLMRFQSLQALIKESIPFFTLPEGIREVSRLVAESEDLYDHGVGVMVLTSSLLSEYGKGGKELLAACSVGALLHDMGKLELPEAVFEDHPDRLSEDDRKLMQSHPALGVSVCSILPLPQESLHCILFHHEMENGSGYPSQASGEMLPFYTRILSLCNTFDGLVRERPWRKGLKSHEAYARIKSMDGRFNPRFIKLLGKILSKAGMA